MELRDITMGDLPLYRELLTDPGTMAELGGPLQAEAPKLRGIVEAVEAGRIRYVVILPDGPTGEAAGTVCIWDHDQDGQTISEIGWMVLPAFQGRGLASQAVRVLLDRARAERRWHVIHAFPGVTNDPSNAICRKLGFTLREEREIAYAGRALRANHWVLNLEAGDPA